MIKCPGSDQRFWGPEDIAEVNCPICSAQIEFWKDEPRIKCPKCKNLVANPKLDIGCAKWCKYAEKCLGTSAKQSDNILCNQLVEEMKRIFAGNQKRITHSLETLKYAGLIQAAEGGNPLVVKASAILLGVAGCNDSSTSVTAKGPTAVRDTLVKYGIEPALVEQVCSIITNYNCGKTIDPIEFRIVHDAEQLANINNQSAAAQRDELNRLIDSALKTTKGRQLATELLAASPKP